MDQLQIFLTSVAIFTFTAGHHFDTSSCNCDNAGYTPMCAEKKTYDNQCFLDCYIRMTNKSVQNPTNGECVETRMMKRMAPPSCVCTEEYDPICGNNGITYPSKCELKCAERNTPYLKKLRSGKCEKDYIGNHPANAECKCGSKSVPVCGKDGFTYHNFCYFRCYLKKMPHLRIEREGKCLAGERNDPILQEDELTYPKPQRKG